jgi:hypothetical protein
MNEQPAKTEVVEAIRSTKTEIFEVIHSTNAEILEAIQSFAISVDGRFDRLEGRVTKIEATMVTKDQIVNLVTKDYLDDKLADLHSDIVRFVKRRVPGWSEA